MKQADLSGITGLVGKETSPQELTLNVSRHVLLKLARNLDNPLVLGVLANSLDMENLRNQIVNLLNETNGTLK